MNMLHSVNTVRDVGEASMSMGSDDCKLSMLLNFNTIDACFLSSRFHVRSNSTFFLACLLSFLLVISLEGLRRFQRRFDRYLQNRDLLVDEEHSLQTRNLLGEELEAVQRNQSVNVVMLEQLMRGLIHGVQFAASYCVMLLFMYSNGYIILSLILGAMVGFALFTRDTLHGKKRTYARKITYRRGSLDESLYEERGKAGC